LSGVGVTRISKTSMPSSAAEHGLYLKQLAWLGFALATQMTVPYTQLGFYLGLCAALLLAHWIVLARKHLPWEGLPARVCWLGLGERARFGGAINRLVADGTLAAPIVITRDHLDTGSVASPYRETEGMADGSDAVADWPLLNAMLNTAAGADMVHIHNGGGVGIGLSTHAGMHAIADGTDAAAARLARVLTTDPGIGVVRHAHAGYPAANRVARRAGLRMPSIAPRPASRATRGIRGRRR